MTKQIETFCNNTYCPIQKHCANFSINDKFNLVEYDFELIKSEQGDEQDVVNCDKFEDIIEDEYYL